MPRRAPGRSARDRPELPAQRAPRIVLALRPVEPADVVGGAREERGRHRHPRTARPSRRLVGRELRGHHRAAERRHRRSQRHEGRAEVARERDRPAHRLPRRRRVRPQRDDREDAVDPKGVRHPALRVRGRDGRERGVRACLRVHGHLLAAERDPRIDRGYQHDDFPGRTGQGDGRPCRDASPAARERRTGIRTIPSPTRR